MGLMDSWKRSMNMARDIVDKKMNDEDLMDITKLPKATMSVKEYEKFLWDNYKIELVDLDA